MSPDSLGTAIGVVIAVLAAVEVVVRRVRSYLELVIPASSERARLRDLRARRRGNKREEAWADPDDETTDINALMKVEDEHRRARRLTRRNERAPRAGTHHDRDEG